MGLDLVQHCQLSLALVQEDVEDGILYMDAGAGEAFHFNGGLPALLDLGARAICSLERASHFDAGISWRGPWEDPVEKVVILTSRLLTESHHDVIRCLRMHPSTKYCTIWTSICEEAHSAHPDTSFGLGAFHDYKTSLLRDLAQPWFHGGKGDTSSTATSKKYDWGNVEDERRQTEDDRVIPNQPSEQQWLVPNIEVKHFPLMVCSITKSLFVFPSGGSVAQAPLSDDRDIHAVSKGIPGINFTLQVDGEECIPAGATLLAHSLHHLAAQLDLKLEVFSLGPLAHIVGKMMSGLSCPPEGIGHPRRTAGLVLVDRSQDLITPSSHGDSLLDRIFASLPRRALAVESALVSHSIVRPPMDIRVPANGEERSASETLAEQGFPFLPVSTVGEVANDGRSKSASCADGDGKLSLAPPRGSSQELLRCRAELLDGSLSTSWDRIGSEYLESLLGMRTKDSLLLLRKWLHEALRQESINIPGNGRLGVVSVNELQSLRRALVERPEVALRHVAVIQVARAAEIALGACWGSRWDAFAGAERILRLSAGDKTQSLALQLQDIVQQCAQSMRRQPLSGHVSSTEILSLRDALTLAIVGYGLAGKDMHPGSHERPFSWDEEQALKEAIVETILQGSLGPPLGFLKGLESALGTLQQGTDTRKKSTPENVSVVQQTSADEEWDRWEGVDTREEDAEEVEEYGQVQLKLELRDRLGEVFGILHRVASACSRSSLLELALTIENQNGVYRGLIYKLLSFIFARKDIPGIEHHTSGMGRFFKGGLGRFGIRQAKPKLIDQKVLLVFVIGGLNFLEVREAREAQAAVLGGDGVELLLGGTTLITPSDMYDLLLGGRSAL